MNQSVCYGGFKVEQWSGAWAGGRIIGLKRALLVAFGFVRLVLLIPPPCGLAWPD